MRWSTHDVYTSASDPPLSLIWALQGGLYWFSQGLDPVAGAHWHHGSLADSSGLTVCMLVQCWWFCLVSCPGPFLFPLLSIALLDDDTPIWVSLFDMFESKLVKLLWLRVRTDTQFQARPDDFATGTPTKDLPKDRKTSGLEGSSVVQLTAARWYKNI